LTFKPYWPLHLACSIAVLTLSSLVPAPARADFFDDMRRTFQTDIPHFFQDDIPCAFGGQPTSHTKTSCKSSSPPAKHDTDKPRAKGAVGSDEAQGVQGQTPPQNPPPSPSQ
jgi:hypothetical protein